MYKYALVDTTVAAGAIALFLIAVVAVAMCHMQITHIKHSIYFIIPID